VRHYTKDNFRLTESVGYQLVKARNLITTEMDAALKDLDISSQQMGIMLMLRQKLASTPFELSKMLGIDTGLMTRMLDQIPEIAPDVLNARLKDFTKAELNELRRLLRKFLSD